MLKLDRNKVHVFYFLNNIQYTRNTIKTGTWLVRHTGDGNFKLTRTRHLMQGMHHLYLLKTSLGNIALLTILLKFKTLAEMTNISLVNYAIDLGPIYMERGWS